MAEYLFKRTCKDNTVYTYPNDITKTVYNFNDKNREHIVWRHKDKYHNMNGPAIEYFDGSYIYMKEGEFHREDEAGPAINDKRFGEKYYLNGELHCITGPAIISPTITSYWLEGKIVRYDDWKVQVRKYKFNFLLELNGTN